MLQRPVGVSCGKWRKCSCQFCFIHQWERFSNYCNQLLAAALVWRKSIKKPLGHSAQEERTRVDWVAAILMVAVPWASSSFSAFCNCNFSRLHRPSRGYDMFVLSCVLCSPVTIQCALSWALCNLVVGVAVLWHIKDKSLTSFNECLFFSCFCSCVANCWKNRMQVIINGHLMAKHLELCRTKYSAWLFLSLKV